PDTDLLSSRRSPIRSRRRASPLASANRCHPGSLPIQRRTARRADRVPPATASCAESMVPRTLSSRLILEIGQAILVADGLEATVAIILDGARRLSGAETVGLDQPDLTD